MILPSYFCSKLNSRLTRPLERGSRNYHNEFEGTLEWAQDHEHQKRHILLPPTEERWESC